MFHKILDWGKRSLEGVKRFGEDVKRDAEIEYEAERLINDIVYLAKLDIIKVARTAPLVPFIPNSEIPELEAQLRDCAKRKAEITYDELEPPQVIAMKEQEIATMRQEIKQRLLGVREISSGESSVEPIDFDNLTGWIDEMVADIHERHEALFLEADQIDQMLKEMYALQFRVMVLKYQSQEMIES